MCFVAPEEEEEERRAGALTYINGDEIPLDQASNHFTTLNEKE